MGASDSYLGNLFYGESDEEKKEKAAAVTAENARIDALVRSRIEARDQKNADKLEEETKGGQGKDLRKFYPFRKEKSQYSLKDYNWVNKAVNYPSAPDEVYQNVQRVIVEEFQPDVSVNTAKIIVDTIKTVVKKGKDLAGKSKVADRVGGIISKTGGKILKDVVLTKGYQAVSNSYGAQEFQNEDELNNQIKMYSNLFAGTFLRYFELPYYDDDYMKFGDHSSWSADSMSEGDNKTRIQTMSMNIPYVPSWECNLGGSDVINSEFELINDNAENLLKNFKFLQNFASGAMWIQLGFFQKSPNVFRVTIPGRKMFFFASMTIECNYMGKRRRNPTVAAKLKAAGVQNADDILFPEAFKVKVSYKSLVPNNFNNQMWFMTRKFEKTPIGTTQSAYTADVKKITKTATESFSKVGGAASNAAGRIAGQLKNGLNG